MYRITFVIDLFKGDQERELSHATLKNLLLVLMQNDIIYLRAHPETPPLFKSGVRYQEEPQGQEDWQDVPTTLKLGIGDCLPIDTKIMREGGALAPLGDLRIGDCIYGDKGALTQVTECATTGTKPILKFTFPVGGELRCSPDHRLFLADGEEIRARDVRVGDELLRLEHKTRSSVEQISTQGSALCADITTDSGRFYLPESDVIVHNCEDLAAWRAAELRVSGEDPKAEPTFIWKIRENGAYLYHILVRRGDGRIEDPSRTLGMR